MIKYEKQETMDIKNSNINKVIKMIYCFDKDLPWDYSKKEIKISKKKGNGILYDSSLKRFIDFNGNLYDIKEKTVFPRTGVYQIYSMNNEIIRQGGIPIVNNEQLEMIDNWPIYYKDNKKSIIIKGCNLTDADCVKEIEEVYGKEIFIKTKSKDFSGIIPTELLLDRECVLYKALSHHLGDDFIISKKVDIVEDKYGKKEYRCFVVDNEVYNISRYTTSVLHEIDPKVLQKAKEITKNLKDGFANSYVLDLFEYQLDEKTYIDVVEFNHISASGPYLYNSCTEKSNDLLHSDKMKISSEFIDKINECTTTGKVIGDRQNLYDMPNGFSNDLRSIYFTGDIGATWIYSHELTEIDFSRHNPIYDFSKAEELDDDYDYLPTQEEADLLKQLSDEEIKKIDDLINKNVVKVKKIK